MAMFMGAIEATIVATALPTIAAKLGGLALYGWVFSAFLLMQAVTIPIYGKLSDLYGRKHVLIVGILIFLAGSALCGIAWSMPALVAFRFVQGVGAGAVQPLSMTLIGDLYTLEERGLDHRETPRGRRNRRFVVRGASAGSRARWRRPAGCRR